MPQNTMKARCDSAIHPVAAVEHLPTALNSNTPSGGGQVEPEPDISRITAFLEQARPATPCLVVDLNIVEGKYR
ncbi:MAG TPA: hypothetical protein VGM59_12175, partial [Dongiaceae bacterium]